MIKDLPNYSRIRSIHAGMKSRCYNSKMPNFKYYGGLGIQVCEEWRNSFLAFYNWAMANGYQEGLTIDRIDVCGNYEPSNCRWVDMKTQDNNRSDNVVLTYNGESHTIPEWSEITGIKQYVIRNRIKRNWSVADALTRKVGKYVYKN